MPAPDSEFLLLRWSACALLGGSDTPEPPGLEKIDWHRLLWLGRRHGALLLLHESLRAHPAVHAGCPADIRAQLGELSPAARLQALARAAEIARLHDQFTAHGIPLVLTDDWGFQQAFDAGRTLVEGTAEIRCAVSPSFTARARDVLAEAGHPEDHARFQLADSGRTPVRLEPGFDPTGLPAGGVSLTLGGRRLPIPEARQWLLLFAVRLATRAPTLFQAWQVALLVRLLGRTEVERLSEAGATGSAPALRRLVAASQALLESPPAAAESAAKRVSSRARDAELPFTPFLPTPPLVGERMLALAGVGPGDVVCDLGCGDGRLVIAAAVRCGARGFGLDRDPALVAAATAQAQAAGVADRVSFVCADLFSADVRAATVICFYLLPALCEPIRTRLLPQARPGTRIVTHDYSFPDWPPEKTELVRPAPAHIAQIYLWRMAGNPPA